LTDSSKRKSAGRGCPSPVGQCRGDKVTGREFAQFAIADGLDQRHGHLLESGNGLLGAVFLDKSQHGVQDDDGNDRNGIFRITQGGCS